MDGMYYRRESENRLVDARPGASVVKLLLLTVVIAVGIVGGMVLLSRAGVNVSVPDEFPTIAAVGG